MSVIEVLISLTVFASAGTGNRHCRGGVIGITVIAWACHHTTGVFGGWCLQESFSQPLRGHHATVQDRLHGHRADEWWINAPFSGVRALGLGTSSATIPFLGRTQLGRTKRTMA